ncbi:hypothetical protein DACRYDRAFT_99586 [Dacryopinax primogenitus]|uniref:Uncharacterized protein n=1 Tax=Dacryopinax primogenitus (strain DJM 731) TaxID=1858805 RepID=M5G4Y8_DACPD|nr:uncharacterized protein DACRYDRAFT_99586 [Dacryopinax primogenitus]EJU03290.1 hypothetical protein DACRYDRAFT_99586 [Dacryopinax primogenitus]
MKLDFVGRGRSMSAPPAFTLGQKQTMMGYIDPAPLISAETYNLPLITGRPSGASARYSRPASASSRRSRRASLASTVSASVYSQQSAPRSPLSSSFLDGPSTPGTPDTPMSMMCPASAYAGSRRSSLGAPWSSYSEGNALHTTTSRISEVSASTLPTVAECPTCRSLAQQTPHDGPEDEGPTGPGRLGLRKLASLIFPNKGEREPVYIDQAHWSFYFPGVPHEGGCGCRGCVKRDPSREEGEEKRRDRVREYEQLRPWRWGWRKVRWITWTRERRALVRARGEASILGRVKVSRVYEVEW